jgi:hypothetical protein
VVSGSGGHIFTDCHHIAGLPVDEAIQILDNFVDADEDAGYF